MRWAIALWISAQFVSAQIVLPPAVTLRPGQQYRFYGQCPTGRKCQFDLGAGHDQSSSITADGTYTAPATAVPHAKLGGCPLMPLSTVFNTNISSLPADPNSVAMINQIVARATGVATLHFSPVGSMIVPVDDQTQKVFLQAYYADMGTGSWPLGTPPYLRVGSKDIYRAMNQVGWRLTDIDNRVMEVHTGTCDSFGFYFYGSIETSLENPKLSAVTSKMSNISSYGVFNTMDWDNAKNKPKGLNGSSNASGMWHAPLQLDVDELMQAVDRDGANANLRHVIGMTLPNVNIRPYSSGDRRWPAVAWAGGYTDGLVPYGTRFRLRKEFVDSFPYPAACAAFVPAISNPTRCQNAIRGVFNTIRDYGVIMMDGTIPSDSGGLHVRSHGRYDPEWYVAAWAITNSKLRGWGNALGALEAIDESALMVDLKSNLVRDPVANPELIRFVDVSNPASPAVIDVRDVLVYPPTLGALFTQVSVAAGAPPLDLKFRNIWASGFKDNNAITWTIVSGPGSVADGKYTAPATLTTPTTTTVRAAHSEDPGQYIDVRIVNFPNIGTGLCIRSGASQPGNAKDKLGRTCWSFDSTGKVQVNPFAVPLGGNLMQVISLDPAFPNGSMWRSGASSDQMAHFHVPNGKYRVSAMAVTPYGSPMDSTKPYDPATLKANSTTIDINGQLVYGPDNVLLKIGAPNTGNTIPATVEVTDGTLVFGWRGEGKFGGGAPYLAGILIESATTRRPPKHRRH